MNFTGFGLETVLGAFTSVASACQNIITLEVSDLVAFDTGPNGVISYRSEPFTFDLDPVTCILTAKKIKYTGEGISGDYVGESGEGKYDFIGLDANCSGQSVESFVTFKDKWELY